MATFDRPKIHLSCPDGSREGDFPSRDFSTRRKAACRRCRSELKFRGGDISQLQRAVRDREKADEKLADSLERAVDNAEKLIK